MRTHREEWKEEERVGEALGECYRGAESAKRFARQRGGTAADED